ncbi:MAG: OmpA family protein [Pseudomonadota bacterium]
MAQTDTSTSPTETLPRRGSTDWPGYILFLLLTLIGIYYVISPYSKLGFDVAPRIEALDGFLGANATSPAVKTAAPATEPEPTKTAALEKPKPNAYGDAAANKAAADSGAVAALAPFDGRLPDGSIVLFDAGGIESKLVGFITDNTKIVDKSTWFDFNSVTFKTGSADLTSSSLPQIRNITKIMTAYPQVALKIGGYTDNTGNADANLALSEARAKSVHDKLVSLGVATDRLSFEGYGDKHPVASNDTAKGRQANRRIAVSVRTK